MPPVIHLSNLWQHTLNEILNHDNKSEVGIMMRAWVKSNKLEDITSLLIYDLNDFTTFTGTFNIPYLNLNMIMMMKNLTTPLMRKIGYCKQEENI